jgi:hypothetical protein
MLHANLSSQAVAGRDDRRGRRIDPLNNKDNCQFLKYLCHFY